MDTASMIMGGAIASVFWIAVFPSWRRRAEANEKEK